MPTLPIPVKHEPPQKASAPNGVISQFIETNFKHYNAWQLVQAAEEFKKQIDDGKKMFVSLAGAMSTGELGITLAEMIRQDKVHGISCTGANLEEDLMNLIAHDDYLPLPQYRTLKPEEEKEILDEGYNRVTDTAIPEEEAFGLIHDLLTEYWKEAKEKGERYFPHEYLYRILLTGALKEHYQIDPKNSWLLAAAEKNLMIVVPGWEDSSMGNAFAADCFNGEADVTVIKTGVEYMMYLADWYLRESASGIGFFQIGGGIAGDFPICVVPMLKYDVGYNNIPFWSYFCQISDSTTSYGGYSGAEPTEKITWGKLGPETPMFVIDSDASICAPLIFAYVLDM